MARMRPLPANTITARLPAIALDLARLASIARVGDAAADEAGPGRIARRGGCRCYAVHWRATKASGSGRGRGRKTWGGESGIGCRMFGGRIWVCQYYVRAERKGWPIAGICARHCADSIGHPGTSLCASARRSDETSTINQVIILRHAMPWVLKPT